MGLNAEIQSSNMFGLAILNIRKVQFGLNMQCFEFFGQRTVNLISTKTCQEGIESTTPKDLAV